MNGMKNKRGLIIPMILCFMLLSHIIYMGIIHLNALHRQRIQQSNHYYQLQIQSLLSHFILYSFITDQWSVSLEETILDDCHLLQKETFNAYKLHSNDLLHPTLNIIKVEDSNSEAFLLLHKMHIYLQPSLNFQPAFTRIEPDGEWLNKQQIMPYAAEVNEFSFETITQELVSQGYNIFQQIETSKEAQWVGTLSNDYQFEFNSGTTFITSDTEELCFSSTLPSGDCFEKRWRSSEINYLLQWQGNLYQETHAN